MRIPFARLSVSIPALIARQVIALAIEQTLPELGLLIDFDLLAHRMV
jgi:hypothetical protein